MIINERPLRATTQWWKCDTSIPSQKVQATVHNAHRSCMIIQHLSTIRCRQCSALRHGQVDMKGQGPLRYTSSGQVRTRGPAGEATSQHRHTAHLCVPLGVYRAKKHRDPLVQPAILAWDNRQQSVLQTYSKVGFLKLYWTVCIVGNDLIYWAMDALVDNRQPTTHDTGFSQQIANFGQIVGNILSAVKPGKTFKAEVISPTFYGRISSYFVVSLSDMG